MNNGHLSKFINTNLEQSAKAVADESKTVGLSKIEAMYGEYYNAMTRLDEGDIIRKTTCLCCVHPARADAEKRYEETNSFSAAARIFDDFRKANPDSPEIALSRVKNHILQHYLQQQKKIWIREYSERILPTLNKRISDEQRLDLLTHQLEYKFNEIAADPQLDPIKQSDAMTKLTKMIIEVRAMQAKMKGEIHDVNMMTDKFVAIWAQTIEREKDASIQRKLIEALEHFQEQSGLPIIDVGEADK